MYLFSDFTRDCERRLGVAIKPEIRMFQACVQENVYLHFYMAGKIYINSCKPCLPFKLNKDDLLIVELVLYVHGQQLRSCRDGQLSYPDCSWTSLPEARYK